MKIYYPKRFYFIFSIILSFNLNYNIQCFDKFEKTGIKVVNFKKIIDTSYSSSSSKSLDKCTSWELNDSTIIKIISVSDTITSYEDHDYFYTYPCYYKGSITIKKDTFQFVINAGGTTRLYNKRTSILLGCKDSTHKELFIDIIDLNPHDE